MAQFPQSFGTAFAVAGFAFDPNLSPNNQAFANAVLATCQRAGLPFGFEPANVVLAGPASGAAALPTYRALTAADVPGGVNGFGNPTNKVSGTATNGTSTLAMRSDGAPALDWAQSPTWTGNHQFTPGAGSGITLTQNNAVAGLLINGSNPEGLRIASTAVNGSYLQVYNSATFVGFFGAAAQEFTGGVATDLGIGCNAAKKIVLGVNQTIQMALNGTNITGLGPVAAAQVDMTPDSTTFQVTLTGVTPAVTGTLTARRMGNMAVLTGNFAGTSNTNACTITGVPAAWQPVTRQFMPCSLQNNGLSILGNADFNAGTIVLAVPGVSGTFVQLNASGFTASGQKGLNQTELSYQLA